MKLWWPVRTKQSYKTYNTNTNVKQNHKIRNTNTKLYNTNTNLKQNHKIRNTDTKLKIIVLIVIAANANHSYLKLY